jgi:hypothetical protein
VNTARGDAERRLQKLLAPRSLGGFNLREDDREVVETRQRVEKFTDEARRLEALYEARITQWQSISRALQACEDWLKNGGIPVGVTLQDHEAEPPKLAKGENVIDAIERIRRRGRELKADLHRIQSAPYPSSYAKQRMREMIEALAQIGTPDVASLVEHDRPIEWARRQVQSEVRGERLALGFAETPDAVALLAWTFKDALISRLDAEINAEADDKSALSHEEREKRAAVVQSDLLDLERQECQLTGMAQAERLPVEHRADINPVALLGVRLVTTAPTNGAGGTSSEHVVTFGGGRW